MKRISANLGEVKGIIYWIKPVSHQQLINMTLQQEHNNTSRKKKNQDFMKYLSLNALRHDYLPAAYLYVVTL